MHGHRIMVVLHGSFVCFSTSWHLHAPHGRLLGVGGLFDLAGCGPFLCTRGLNIRPNKSNCQNPAVPEPHGEILSQPLMLDRSHLECDCLPQLFLRVSGVPMAHGVETHSYAKCFAGKFRSEKYKEETAGAAERNPAQFQRSEEHTSELQSRLHLVCRLLLEKKKKLTRLHSPSHTHTRHCSTTRSRT